MPYIIVDTSSILFGAEHMSDVFEAVERDMIGYTPVISLGIVNELKHIGKSKRHEHAYANAALDMLGRHNIETVKNSGPVDAWIRKEAFQRKCIVCTNDIELKRSLKERGVGVVSVSRGGQLR